MALARGSERVGEPGLHFEHVARMSIEVELERTSLHYTVLYNSVLGCNFRP